MTALAEALLAAQRQAIGALSKAYVAGLLDEENLRGELVAVGATDVVEIGLLLNALGVLKTYGTAAPPNGKPEPASEPASEAQLRFIAKLADEAHTTAPDGPLTKEQASQAITELKAGTYSPDAWTVPF